MKKILITLFIFVSLLIIFLLYRGLFQEVGQKNFNGIVYDCDTGDILSDAKVKLLQQSLPTWDKVYEYSAVTDTTGHFSIDYNIGSTIHVEVSKDGYLVADEWGYTGKTKIGLIKKTPNEKTSETSRMCKRNSECNKVLVENGVSRSENICGSLPKLD